LNNEKKSFLKKTARILMFTTFNHQNLSILTIFVLIASIQILLLKQISFQEILMWSKNILGLPKTTLSISLRKVYKRTSKKNVIQNFIL
jgi:hypothetical protein